MLFIYIYMLFDIAMEATVIQIHGKHGVTVRFSERGDEFHTSRRLLNNQSG